MRSPRGTRNDESVGKRHFVLMLHQEIVVFAPRER
jgi:hypothetical protein